MINVLKRMYANTEVLFIIGDITSIIKYGVGVKQGDPMAPVLFIFVIQAALDLALTTMPIKERISFLFNPTGSITPQLKPASTLSKHITISDNSEYVDDAAILFGSREDITVGMKHIHSTFLRFGLLVHTGNNMGIDKKERNQKQKLCTFLPINPKNQAILLTQPDSK